MAKNLMKQLERRKRKEEARAEATDMVLDVWNKFCVKADVSMLYTLHKDFGFGAKRLEKFYFNMLENHISMIEQFRSNKDDDDTHYLVMAERLEAAGLDIKALQDKADKVRMPECDYEERQRIIKEWKDENPN